MFILLVAVPSVYAAPSTTYSEFTSYDGTTYYYGTYGSNQPTYRATVFGAETDSEGVYIPTVIEGYNVTVIEENAFAECTSLRYAVIPERVSEIKAGAFDCSSLERVYFLGDAPAMDSTAFPLGAEFYRPDGKDGWSGSEQIIETVTLSTDGSDVHYHIIEGEAMAVGGTPSVDGTVTLTSHVNGMNGTYPVTSVGPYSFSGKENETNTDIVPRTDIGKFISADSTVLIRERAFYYNTGIILLESVSDLEIIADEAFRMATSLTSYEVMSGDHVRYIGFEAFRNCSSLTEVYISDATVFIGEGAFKICRFVERLRIGAGLEDISTWTFAYFDSLTNIVFEGSPKTIGNSAFYMCASLVTVSLPDSVEYLGSYAFYRCESLENVYLGKNLVSIGTSAFEECSVLNNVRVPATVTSVSSKAFAYCPEMSDIYFDGEKPEFGNSVFLNNSMRVHVNKEYLNSWADFDWEVVTEDDTNTVLIVSVAIVSVVLAAAAVFILKRKVFRNR